MVPFHFLNVSFFSFFSFFFYLIPFILSAGRHLCSWTLMTGMHDEVGTLLFFFSFFFFFAACAPLTLSQQQQAIKLELNNWVNVSTTFLFTLWRFPNEFWNGLIVVTKCPHLLLILFYTFFAFHWGYCIYSSFFFFDLNSL